MTLIRFADELTAFPTSPTLTPEYSILNNKYHGVAEEIARTTGRVIEVVEPSPYPCCGSRGTLHAIKCPVVGNQTTWPRS